MNIVHRESGSVQKETGWQWHDGTKFEWKGWKDGQPNNHNPPEDCLEFHGTDQSWNDANCDELRRFVCCYDNEYTQVF